MITKKLTSETIKKYSLHNSFLAMLNACINSPEKWDVEKILAYWWNLAFPLKPLTMEELNDETIDKIRIRLLIRGGVVNPILSKNKFINKIKSNIIFSEE